MRFFSAAIIFSLTFSVVQAEPLKINCPPQLVTQDFSIGGTNTELKESIELKIPDDPSMDKWETTIEERENIDGDGYYIVFEGKNYKKQKKIDDECSNDIINEYQYNGTQKIDRVRITKKGHKPTYIEYDLCIRETITAKCPRTTPNRCVVSVSKYSQFFCGDEPSSINASLQVDYDLKNCGPALSSN